MVRHHPSQLNMKSVFVYALCFSLTFGAIEIVELTESVDPDVRYRRWTGMASGGLYVDSLYVYMCDENKLNVISRRNPNNVQLKDLELDGSRNFKLLGMLPTKESYYFTLYPGDGRFYFLQISRFDLSVQNFFEKHANPNRMLFYDGRIYASALYWPGTSNYLNKYGFRKDHNVTDDDQNMFYKLYEDQRGFTITVYDKNASMVDSLNMNVRRGEDAAGFYSLYMTQPFDISKDGEIFIMDSERGYILERYGSDHKHISDTKISNSFYKAVPQELNRESPKTLRKNEGSYSDTYAVYEKGEYVIVGFYPSAVPPNIPKGPFYFDVIKKDGVHIFSGMTSCPFVGEDEKNLIFFYKKVEGGWFEDDRVFLVGMTIDDILSGKASDTSIDNAISRYSGE